VGGHEGVVVEVADQAVLGAVVGAAVGVDGDDVRKFGR
jgi:hypothetical protein